jgi:hypothetical protein
MCSPSARARLTLTAVLALAPLRAASAQAARPQAAPPAPAPDGATPAASPIAAERVDAPTDRAPRLLDLQNAPPPPTNVVFLQYGVALTAEVVTAAGPICDNVGLPCILGPGGGVAVRVGWRGAGPFYFGGAYELSKQDPNKLLRLAILQQARAEGRYYFVSGRLTEPYLAGGLGVAGYGNEWGVDTWGPGGFGGFGIETQVTRRTVIGVALAYRALYFQDFVDTTGAARSAGLSQLFGVDLVLEQRDPIYTEGSSPR